MFTAYTSRLFVFLISLFIVTGCAQTTVTGLWKKSDFAGEPFSSILVVGLTGDANTKILWENVMVDKLRQNGVKTAVPCASAFPDEKELTEQKIIDFVTANNVQAVLVTRMVDTKKEEVYHPPTGGYYTGPYGYYNRFNRYYPHAYETIYTPGYTQTLTTVLLETNLYSSNSKELIWSMSTDTFDPSSMTQLVDSVSGKVLELLLKDKLI
jgi:hypothetical protein